MEDDKLIEQIDSETSDDYTDDDLYKIKSWGADITFRELSTMYKENELVKPEIQRNYVWSKDEASRFIDSLLLGLPVPSIFLANDKNNNKIIVDGYQRIMTVYDYMEGIWAGDKLIFKLSKSEKINKRWAGKAFKELEPKEQKKIKATTIHAIVFEQSHPADDDTSLYQIFERINTSGRSLTPQEIRNCVYQGNLNKLLIELNSDVNWRLLFGSRNPDPRMRDIEFILRFFLMQDTKVRHKNDGKMQLKKQLNVFMGDRDNNNPNTLKIFEYNFKNTMEKIALSLGEKAFRRTYSQSRDKQSLFHPTIFDSIAISFSLHLSQNGSIPKDIAQRKDVLLDNDDYKNYISNMTTRYDHINGRVKIAYDILFS
jgi:uncharacterized protein with ParB-like and HNH nuclease domain